MSLHPEPKVIEQKFDESNPIVAYRCWNMIGGRLVAVTQNSIWPILKRTTAECSQSSYNAFITNSPPHNAPHEKCGCGLHAYQTFLDLMKNEASSPYYSFSRVYGVVSLWGTIVEHKDGYRAEFGYPQMLYLPTEEYETGYDIYGRLVARSDGIKFLADAYKIETAPSPFVELEEPLQEPLPPSPKIASIG